MRVHQISEQSRERLAWAGAGCPWERRRDACGPRAGVPPALPGRNARRACSAVLLAVLLFFPTLLLAEQRPARDEAVSLAVAGEYQRAYDIFRNLLHDAPDDPLLNYYTGTACIRMNKHAEGIDYLEKAVAREAPFPQAYQELGEAYLKSKLNKQAQDVVEKGLRRFPKNQGLQKLSTRLQKLKAPE